MLGISSKSFLIFLLFFCLAACAPTIGNRTNLEDVKFELGKTHKNEVIEVLGLPSAMDNISEEGTEIWAYQDAPTLSSLMIPVPILGTGVMTQDINLDNPPRGFEGAKLLCRFDQSGVLTFIKWNK